MHFATEFWLTRFCFQRSLGCIYLIAFLIAANQFIPLLGERGLQPVRRFLRYVSFQRAPSLFFLNCSDRFIMATIWGGIALSIFSIFGWSDSFGLIVSMLTWAVLWMIYLSPPWAHKAGVLFTHFAQLVVPWFYFAPAPICYWAGGLTILFQITLILSGNLSWLNYITIVLCIPCFDDRLLARFIHISHSLPEKMTLPHEIAVIGLVALVLYLSIRPARNLFSRRQLMNASFEPLHLVNTYGAFGAVTRQRLEVVIKGTDAEFPDASP